MVNFFPTAISFGCNYLFNPNEESTHNEKVIIYVFI